MRITSNAKKTAAGSGTAKCDPAYVMVTGQIVSTDAAADKTLILTVAEYDWAKTMEERLVTRPTAVTKNTKKKSSTWIAYSAISASMVALTLF